MRSTPTVTLPGASRKPLGRKHSRAPAGRGPNRADGRGSNMKKHNHGLPMKLLPSIAGVIGITLTLAGPIAAQTPSGGSSTSAGSTSSASTTTATTPAAGDRTAASGAQDATSATASDATAPAAAAAGSTAQAPSTVARPAVPTTSPVAPVSSTASSTASTAATPAADVRTTAQDPDTDLVTPASRATTAARGSTVASDAGDRVSTRDGGTSRRVLGSGPGATTVGGVERNSAAGRQTLSEIPSVGVSSTATVAYLRAVDVAQRSAALDRVEAQLADTNRAINRLPQSAPTAPATAQVDYAAALQELQARESQLRSSLTAAQQADEVQWAEARNRLAADYDAYIAATHRARAAAVNLDPTVAPAE